MIKKLLCGLTAILVLSVNLVFAANFQIIEDSDFDAKVYESNGMQIEQYAKTVRNKFGSFTKQFTATSSSASVTYKIPEGNALIGFEVVVKRAKDDGLGLDDYTVKCSKDGNNEVVLDKADKKVFMISTDNTSGEVIDLFTTDAIGAVIQQNGYNTLKLEFKPVEGQTAPIGIQYVALYYSPTEFIGVYKGEKKLTSGDTVSGGLKKIDLKFNALVDITKDNLVLKKNGEPIEFTTEADAAVVSVIPKEGFKYGCEYKMEFSEELKSIGIVNFPNDFTFKTSVSDFVASNVKFTTASNKVSVEFDIESFSDTDIKAIACLITYKDGMILDKNYNIIDKIEKGKITHVSTGKAGSENADDVILMVWDNLLDMNPLISAIKGN